MAENYWAPLIGPFLALVCTVKYRTHIPSQPAGCECKEHKKITSTERTHHGVNETGQQLQHTREDESFERRQEERRWSLFGRVSGGGRKEASRGPRPGDDEEDAVTAGVAAGVAAVLEYAAAGGSSDDSNHVCLGWGCSCLQ